jgi:hypothetical protein
MLKERNTVEYTYNYGHGITLRKSGMSKREWEYVVKRFEIFDYPSENVISITVEGADQFGRVKISFDVVE